MLYCFNEIVALKRLAEGNFKHNFISRLLIYPLDKARQGLAHMKIKKQSVDNNHTLFFNFPKGRSLLNKVLQYSHTHFFLGGRRILFLYLTLILRKKSSQPI